LDIFCHFNEIQQNYDPLLFDFANDNISTLVANFHKSLPNYKPTPLISLSSLAKNLGIKELLIKDESKRFDLKAFKILGASYAMAKTLGRILHLDKDELEFNHILSKKSHYEKTTFVTATDGNHGCAVAWAAKNFGCKALVYLPKGSASVRLKAIEKNGATAKITNLNYDETVVFAAKTAKENGWVILQDTSWEEYEEIPTHIMQGYFTLMYEFLSQRQKIWPSHVFVQAGVGSLAAAILAFFCNLKIKPKPIFVVVEPSGAPCVYSSIQINNGEPKRIKYDLNTIMAGLSCGEPSHLALKMLKNQANAFIKCSDNITKHGMQLYANPHQGDSAIVSGESGAVTLGIVSEILSNPIYSAIKDGLDINGNSTILLFSTEGDTDPHSYAENVQIV